MAGGAASNAAAPAGVTAVVVDVPVTVSDDVARPGGGIEGWPAMALTANNTKNILKYIRFMMPP